MRLVEIRLLEGPNVYRLLPVVKVEVAIGRTRAWRGSRFPADGSLVHLGRKVSGPGFIKVGPSGKRISHVVLVRTAEELRMLVPYLREAFDLAVSEE